MAPRSYRGVTNTSIPWFVGPRIADLVDRVYDICPPVSDPLLVNRTEENRRLPGAGQAFHRARLWEIMSEESRCREAWREFVDAWTDQPSGKMDE